MAARARKHPGGRPRKGADKRNRFVQLRLTQDEWKILEQAAGGYPVASFVRIEVLKIAERLLAKARR